MADDATRSERPSGESVDALHRRGLREMEVYLRTGDLAALRRARDLNRRAVAAASEATPGWDIHLRNLANAEDHLYRHTRDLPTLERAVDLYRRALAAAPAQQPYRASYLYGLGRALRRLHQHTGEPGPLEEAVGLLRTSVRMPSQGPAEPAAQAGALAEALGDLYELSGNPDHLEEALGAQRLALGRTPPGSPEEEARRTNLAAYLEQWYRLTRDRTALDEAVALLRRVRDDVLRDGGTPRWQQTVNLASWLADLFRIDGRLGELDEAVALLQHLLEADAEDSFDATYRLMVTVRVAGLALLRAELSGQVRWADRAVRTLQTALRDLPYEDINHGVVLCELGKAHAGRHELTDDPADSAAAVARLRAAVEAFGLHESCAGNSRAAASLLASQLLVRHQRTGSPADLDEAIALRREAVRDAPPQDHNYAALHAALGQSLMERFHTRHDLADLDLCTDHLAHALTALPAGDPERAPVLATLSSAQLARYQHTAHRPHLDEAVATQREALRASRAGDSTRPALLGNLALLLRLRHDTDGGTGPADADEAVGLLRQALALRPGRSDHNRITVLQLAEALRSRADVLGDVADLEECVELLRTLIAGYPPGHPAQIASRSALAEALHKLSLATEDGQLLEEAHTVALGAVAVDTAPVHARLRARATLGQVCGTRHDWEGARHWLTEAVRMLPRLAARDLTRTDQQYVLAREHGLAAEAAAYALQAGRPEQALEVLEHGRGVLLGRLLRSRDTDVARLRERAPELAERFVRLRDAQDPDPVTAAVQPEGLMREAVERMRVREIEWDLLMAQIRALPGMDGFLRPPSAADIVRRAGNGPVVVINISIRCDAMIVADGAVEVVPLRTTLEEVHDRVARFLGAVNAPGSGAAGLSAVAARQETVAELLEWLWDTVTGPVLERLAATAPVATAPAGTPSAGTGAAPGRVWWCPQGPLAFLPLHAAGYHGPRADPDRPRCALDRAVSSYTPTVAALHHARARRVPAARSGARPLVVTMSRTPGQGALPNAAAEALTVGRHLAGPRGPVALADEAVTRDNVLEALRHAPSAHFACHAVADPQDPSACRILTYDHATSPLTVTDVAGLRLDGAHLAFLSACATSSTRHDLVDEAIHITGAFQLAGFRHVVGTLWPVADELAPEVAESFYAALAGGPQQPGGASAGHDHAAHALHAAVAELHSRYVWFPSLWASYIHVGV
ncbi:CHAT domain-containing protein [Streptomyces xanthophaeus]|uniref:CHAT domain-containing protein n=1 Tax=Streptomyces xanthophaeus TaxID=67385 RepID=A0A919LB21_9ACTN|nr:CHAT domain-containing protein [Streptomyces xanthophaeus]GHI83480.1 CHAT domain-containing protein [Streptomyces xanthophaeus]